MFTQADILMLNTSDNASFKELFEDAFLPNSEKMIDLRVPNLSDLIERTKEETEPHSPQVCLSPFITPKFGLETQKEMP